MRVTDRSELLGIRDRWSRAVGETLSGAIAASLLWSALQASRVSASTGSSWVSSMLASTALALIPMLLVVLAMRWVGWSLKRLEPEVEKRRFLMAVLWSWAGASTVAWSIFGRLLHAATHHRGLGGATFGIVGAIAAVGCGIVVLRVGRLAAGWLQRRAVAMLVAVCSGALMLLATHGAIQAAPGSHGSPAAAAAWDILAALLSAALGASVRIRFPYSRLAAPASSGVFVLLVAAGMTVAPGVARAQSSASQRAPIVGMLLKLVRARNAAGGSSSSASASASASTSPAPRGPASAAAQSERATPPPDQDKPDVILVSLDSVRLDHVGVYGAKRATTAALDALADQAAIFERAYAAGPETRTAIAPLVTGKTLEQSAHDDRPWPTLLDSEDTLAERLQRAGYATAAVTSFQWLSKERGFAQGFELFDEGAFRKVHVEKWSSSAHAVAQAMQAYEQLSKRHKPLFLWLHLFDAHQKYLEHAEFAFGDTDEQRYDAEIAFQDRQLGRLIERVNAGERAGRTVWIVHGTHGEAFGEHGLKAHPPSGFDPIVRVPLIVRLPEGSSRRVTDAVSTMDIAPTILELAGVKSTGMVGQSLRELAQGEPPSQEGAPAVAISYAGVPGTREREQLRVWVAPPWKLVVQGAKASERVSLYDFATDAAEAKDLAQARADEVRELREQLDAWFARASGKSGKE